MVEAEMEVGPCYVLMHVTLYCVLLQQRFHNVSSSERTPVLLVKADSTCYSLNTQGKLFPKYDDLPTNENMMFANYLSDNYLWNKDLTNVK